VLWWKTSLAGALLGVGWGLYDYGNGDPYYLDTFLVVCSIAGGGAGAFAGGLIDGAKKSRVLFKNFLWDDDPSDG